MFNSTQIIIGYADERGDGKPILLAGPDMPRDKQLQIWMAAKAEHKFPKGIVRMILKDCTDADIAIFISDEVTVEYAERKARDLKDLDARRARRENEDKHSRDLYNASEAMRFAAVKRNDADRAFLAAKRGNDAKKIAAAKAAFESANNTWTEAKAVLAKLKS